MSLTIDKENVQIIGFEHAIRGMRNPLESWNKSDTTWNDSETFVGAADETLMIKLANAGTDHGKFARFIQLYVDIEAPLYWWKQFMTYRMGVEVNSTSTMHTLSKKELSVEENFAVDGLKPEALATLEQTVKHINELMNKYNETKDRGYWDSAIKLLPDSFLQKRTCMISYAALRNMYESRKGHKLKEWHQFCEFIEGLYCSGIITGKEPEDLWLRKYVSEHNGTRLEGDETIEDLYSYFGFRIDENEIDKEVLSGEKCKFVAVNDWCVAGIVVIDVDYANGADARYLLKQFELNKSEYKAKAKKVRKKLHKLYSQNIVKVQVAFNFFNSKDEYADRYMVCRTLSSKDYCTDK